MKNDLTHGPISNWLIKLTSPMVLGILSIFLFNLVDTYFISLLGTAPLAAVSFTFPVTMMVMNIAIGLSIATGALVSKSIGQKNHEQTQSWVTSSVYLSIFLGICIAIIGYFTQTWVFQAMGAEQALMPLINEYLDVWYLGCVFLIVMIAVNACIRATGNTKLPSLIMLLSAVLNGILDPLLIFGVGPFPELGVQGAAIATIISWAVGFFIILKTLMKMDLLSLDIPKQIVKQWRALIKLGIPATLTNMLGPLANGIIVAWVATHGTHAVAAYGVGSRLEPLALIVVMALTASLPPFVGQNFGAKRLDRIEEGLKKSIGFVILWQLFVYVGLVALATPISELFSDDIHVQNIIQTFLYILPLSYLGLGVCLVSTATLNALHLPKYSLAITILRLFALYIPLAWLGHMYYGLNGIFWGCSMANLLIGFYILWVFYRAKHSEKFFNKLMRY